MTDNGYFTMRMHEQGGRFDMRNQRGDEETTRWARGRKKTGVPDGTGGAGQSELGILSDG